MGKMFGLFSFSQSKKDQGTEWTRLHVITENGVEERLVSREEYIEMNRDWYLAACKAGREVQIPLATIGTTTRRWLLSIPTPGE